MTWIDDEDVHNVLAHLFEAKGSIGAIMDLADEKQAAALLENHRRIACAISILLDAMERKRKSELIERVVKQIKEPQ